MTPFEALVHRLNNLLGTIDLQVEVARSDGSLAAHAQALAFIAESAARTKQELRALQQRERDGASAAD